MFEKKRIKTNTNGRLKNQTVHIANIKLRWIYKVYIYIYIYISMVCTQVVAI